MLRSVFMTGIESLLKVCIKLADSETAPMHRRENLDIINRINAEMPRQPIAYHRDQCGGALFRVLTINENKIRVLGSIHDIRNFPIVDGVRATDDPTIP